MRSCVMSMLLVILPYALMAAESRIPGAGEASYSGLERNRPDTYRFVYDLKRKGSMESGVSLAWNASLLLYRGGNYLSDKTGVHDHWYSRPLFLAIVGFAYPTPKRLLHEYYGHGAALREFGYKDISYRWSWFNGGSKSGFAYSDRILTDGTYEEKQLWIGGGVGASQFYLLEAEKDMYRKGRTSLSMFQPVMASKNDLSYLNRSLNANTLNELNDGSTWLGNFKDRYNRSHTAGIAKKSRKAIKTAGFDPVLPWLALTCLHYLWTGDDSFYAPMIPLAGLRFGFSPKMNLTPLGPENYYYGFIGRNGRLASIYYRIGNSPEGKVKGYGAEFGPIKIAGLALTPGYDQWKLPDAKITGLAFTGKGHNAQLKLDAPLYGALGLTAKAAYKTRGYMLGLPAHSGFYGYGGVSLTF